MAGTAPVAGSPNDRELHPFSEEAAARLPRVSSHPDTGWRSRAHWGPAFSWQTRCSKDGRCRFRAPRPGVHGAPCMRCPERVPRSRCCPHVMPRAGVLVMILPKCDAPSRSPGHGAPRVRCPERVPRSRCCPHVMPRAGPLVTVLPVCNAQSRSPGHDAPHMRCPKRVPWSWCYPNAMPQAGPLVTVFPTCDALSRSPGQVTQGWEVCALSGPL